MFRGSMKCQFPWTREAISKQGRVEEFWRHEGSSLRTLGAPLLAGGGPICNIRVGLKHLPNLPM